MLTLWFSDWLCLVSSSFDSCDLFLKFRGIFMGFFHSSSLTQIMLRFFWRMPTGYFWPYSHTHILAQIWSSFFYLDLLVGFQLTFDYPRLWVCNFLRSIFPWYSESTSQVSSQFVTWVERSRYFSQCMVGKTRSSSFGKWEGPILEDSKFWFCKIGSSVF